MKKTHKRISAAVLSLALGFSVAGAPALAPMASAQSINAGQASSVNLGADVSLTINKYDGEIDDTTTPLGGADFTVAKVDLNGENLNTVDGWTVVNNIQAALDAGTTPDLAGDAWELTTDSTGTVTISTGTTNDNVDGSDTANFTVGLYLVTEKQNGNFSVGKPFLVALPFTNGDGEWGYQQTVEPKNQLLSVEKDVSDLGTTLNMPVNYTINASVPAEELDRFNIIDALPAELDLGTDTAITVTVINTTPSVTLVETTDYSIDPTEFSNDTIKIEFTETGLEKLETARVTNPNLQIQVTFTATIVELPEDGVIRNDVVVELPNGGSITTDPEDPDDPDTGAETRLGTLTINKRDVNGALIEIEGDVTRGASFELWRCEEITSDTWEVSEGPLSAAIENEQGDLINVNEFTTATNGVALLEGVQIRDWVNNGAPAESEVDPDLCVVETIAPTGYVLNPAPQPVNVDSSDEFIMTADVINLEDTIDGQLPSTGGMGTMAMIAGGLLVAVAGGFAALRGNRARG
ncbi:SpaH/EbpB family LPXTG-anchored major pilin [Corynebacterium sp. YIM 101645]|uniref:SpaH/EbpB family LPXTG-anchored major pilin n=1 Tax=Corynebacterium lemuris TaxID=1859292 RepID=A0ABT2FZ29_9CORY|nr:SpaH/EbpB family LPXTG-anchored major pilin [Corynebacterium lemuris]MCS5480505.1 SpaH/EbpB family LPXTG-anchored major pilin [Corynebacterium lemuris]